MEYSGFIKLLEPAINILNGQNEEFKSKFGKGMFSFQKATLEELNKLATNNNIEIPNFYKSFLVDNNPKRFEIMFHGLLGLDEITSAINRIGSVQLVNSECLPIMTDGSGNYFCIKKNDKTLYIADHEQNYKIQAFDSLSLLLSRLVEEKVNEYRT